jgi:hypothetical protein
MLSQLIILLIIMLISSWEVDVENWNLGFAECGGSE